MAALTTIDHLESVHNESPCIPPYLTQHLSCVIENIHQYTSICTHQMYTVRFFSSYIFKAPGVKRYQNLPVLIWNPTELILQSSRILRFWDPINNACIPSENQFSTQFVANRCAPKNRIVWAWRWAARASLRGADCSVWPSVTVQPKLVTLMHGLSFWLWRQITLLPLFQPWSRFYCR